MLELAGVVVSFVLILYLVNRKVHLAYAMLASSLALLITSPLGVVGGAEVAWRSAVARETLEFVLTISLVGVLARLMQEFGLLPAMVDALVGLLRSTRAALVAVPGLVGLLPVMGGAVISAPLVDRLSDRLEYGPEHRAAINLVFRHCWFFVYPFGSSLILLSGLSGIPVGQIAAYQWPITVAAAVSGYLLLLRGGRAEPPPEKAWNPWRELRVFMISGGPLLLSLALALALAAPLYLAIMAGIVLALLLSRGHPQCSLSTVWRGVDRKLAAAMIGVMVFRGLIQGGGVIEKLIMSVSGNGLHPAVFFALVPLAVGLVSASQTTSVAICYPLLMPLLRPGDPVVPYTSLLFAATFISYFGSPLHMCQILTLEHFRCRALGVYRMYWPYLLAIAVTALALFFTRT